MRADGHDRLVRGEDDSASAATAVRAAMSLRWGWAARLALPALALLVVALAGCGENSSSTTASTPSQAASAPATSAAAPTTTSTGTSASGGTSTSSQSGGASATQPTTSKSTSTPARTSAGAAAAAGVLGAGASTGKTSPLGRGKAGAQVNKAKALLGTFGSITLSSSAFKAGGELPKTYTCDGAGTSPPMSWQGIPHGAAQLYLTAVDFGAGLGTNSVQWALLIPTSASGLPAGSLPAGTVAGTNGAGKIGWGGVCGAKGKPQHITFLLYALRKSLSLPSGFRANEARAKMKGDILGTGFTAASYERG